MDTNELNMDRMLKAEKYGQSIAAIYIPSRYQDGQLIPEEMIIQAETRIRGYYAKNFGGGTGADEAQGSFEHNDGRIIDEKIRRVWVGLSENALKDENNKQDIFKQATILANKLDQEAIAVEWCGEIWGIKPSSKRKTKRIPFNAFASRYQDEMVCLSLRRIQNLEDMASLLSLNGWVMSLPICSFWHTKLRRLCEKGKRQAFIIPEKTDSLKRQKIASILKEYDLLFDEGAEGAIRVWLKRDDRLIGGRKIDLVDTNGRIPRKSIILALSLLESKREASLDKVLDRSALTRQFFTEYNVLKERIEGLYSKQGITENQSQQEAQLLLGRMMLIRFLEEKGWMVVEKAGKKERCKNFLAESFRDCSADYYQTFLEPLFFDVLDVPENKRAQSNPLPFLNGGLFKKTYHSPISLPDELFDPDQVDSILGTFSRYEFTLDESADSRDLVSIDPSMFGHVLESLCAKEERKNKGVHYTPPVIANTLAFESIVSRLADLTGIDEKKLRKFVMDDDRLLNEKQAETVINLIHDLRIVDPAVGSGSLLLAALNQMMNVKQRCAERLGQSIRPGQYKWAQTVRRFVRESLYGVDIDPNAVEVAKLRLWLAIAVGDNEARPLPDLGHNIRVGDSLSEIKAQKNINQLELEFNLLAKLRNQYKRTLNAYRKVDEENVRTAAEKLEASERAFVIESLSVDGSRKAKTRARAIENGGPIPFYWHIHFYDVFSRKHQGFDIVIANPPYVRIQHLRYSFKDSFEDYQDRFDSIKKGASDIYLAFVEQGMRLAGKSGRLAYIIPNFSRTATGESLRNLLAKTGAVDRWVDYSDIQVFKTASNYVALLFASATKRSRKTFPCVKPEPDAWPPDVQTDWLSKSPKGTVYYDTIWRTRTTHESKLINSIEANSIPLGDLIENRIGVGIQTSADKVFLLKDVRFQDDDTVVAFSTELNRDVRLEKDIIKPCAKGSLHLRPYQVKHEMILVWPYDSDHQLLKLETLEKQYPLAWNYLKKCKKSLKGREGGKFNGPEWWRFGRNQGCDNSCNSKLLIPSTMNQGIAVFDEQGEIAYTASGKGGGGAWGILLDRLDKRVSPRWLLAVLNSQIIWEWIKLEGDPKKGGWRGVDKALIARLPIPIPSNEIQEKAIKLIIDLEKLMYSKMGWQSKADHLERVIKDAYRTQ